MQDLDRVVITPEFRSRVQALAERLGESQVVASSRWADFARSLGLDPAGATDSAQGARVTNTCVIVGSLADVLKHAAGETGEFGFVMPVAQTPARRLGGGSGQWRDDATLDLWHAGWSCLNIDRLRLVKADMIVEFVIGNARRTPVVSIATPD